MTQTIDHNAEVWRIEPGHVGPAELGKPLPKVLLVEDLGKRYVARLIADGQPIDAFKFDDPPLMVIVAGPYTSADDTAEDPTPRFRDKAVAAARSNATIEAVLITGEGPRTAAKIGVGSTFAELQQAYDDAKLVTLPPTLGKDGCVATTRQLPGVAFVFESCAKAKAGERVTRVDVRP